MAAFALLVAGAPALAGIAPLDARPPDRPKVAAEAYVDFLTEFAPGAIVPPIDYGALNLPPVSCEAGAKSQVRAVLIGASTPNLPFNELKGPDNDVGLLAASLKARGVPDDNLAVLTGEAATRAGVAAAFTDLLGKVGCRDHVLIHFSGNASPGELMLQTLIPQPLKDEFNDISIGEQWNSDFTNVDHQPTQALQRMQAAGLLLALNTQNDSVLDLLSSLDLSENLRNRQADVTVVLDTSYAASADLSALQQKAGDSSFWSLETSGAEDEPPPALYAAPTPLSPTHGGFAAFYSSVGNSHSVELGFDNPDGSRTDYGIFSFRLATVIQNRDTVTVRALAESLKALRKPDNMGVQRYRVDASDPELVLFDDGSRQLPQTDAIVITKPTPKRGAAAMEKAEVEIEGRVNWAAPVKAVLVDGRIAELRSDSVFRYTLALKVGINTVEIVALTGDGRTHGKTLDFVFEGDKQALQGEGRRYAVIVANEHYDRRRTGFSELRTPFEDADAVAAILTSRYGFVTEATMQDGTVVPLFLKDASGRDIQTVLYKIGLVAGAKDTVLIYYAGHGIYEPKTTTAYWVPIDAEEGVPISYLSASAITEAIQRMEAGKVVLISDSCFSGALLRCGGEAAPSIDQAERDRALLSLSQRRSRVLISSGNNEPVEDSGGRGHSIFAQALLTGLEDMRYDAFSARELFDGYLLPLVVANADQEPQYRPIDRAGHEGGDIVFVRVTQ